MDQAQGTSPSPNPQTSATPSKSKSPIILAVIGVIAAIGVLGGMLSKKSEEPKKSSINNPPPGDNGTGQPNTQKEINSVQTIPESPSAKQAPADIPAGQTYKDGSYEADGSYQSPGGQDTIHLSVTLKDSIITDTSIAAVEADPKSQMYISNFGRNYKSIVVGKKINEANLTQVSGSSLTPIGFNAALAKIASQAKM